MKTPFVYHDQRNKVMRISILVVLVLCYTFFFSSKLLLPPIISPASAVTSIGQVTEYTDGRSAVLVSAKYAKEQRLMEVTLQLTNDTFDNVNDYYYSFELLGRSPKNVEIKEVMNDQLITVLQFHNLKSFDECTLYFAPKSGKLSDVTDDETGIFILNKHNIDYVNHIETGKTETDYLRERLHNVIAEYEESLETQNRKLEKLQTKVEALLNENAEMERNKKYLTAIELDSSEDKIKENLEVIAETKTEISAQETKVKNLEKLIAEAKEKEAALN